MVSAAPEEDVAAVGEAEDRDRQRHPARRIDHDGGAEFAHRQREAQPEGGEQIGRDQRQRDAAQTVERPRAETGGDLLESGETRASPAETLPKENAEISTKWAMTTIAVVPFSSSGFWLNATSRPRPTETDGTALGTKNSTPSVAPRRRPCGAQGQRRPGAADQRQQAGDDPGGEAREHGFAERAAAGLARNVRSVKALGSTPFHCRRSSPSE